MTAPALKPPTAALGYADYSFYGFSLTDALEHVPALHFPASNAVYAEMRRDPQLAAVLAGITLPIRRATWHVDPTGCRPEVAKMVADDLGIQVAGSDDPGPARTRGVSWPEHLRSALLHLVYGFYTFELLADVSTGQARLAGLLERVPASIAWLHADPDGGFAGVSQVLRPHGKGDEPEIPADRLVHYVHDREGSAWHGTSMLRPGYSSWLIKQDLRRVLATSNRRFATGVPTIEWAPGSNPTPEQFQQAQQAVSAARVGEVAGMTLPPGAHLVLTGLSGSVPNTLDALRWVDQQMSGMVLSRWMDLGSSQTGSRALGEAFIDTFLLSIQALADQIADTATRQVAARIVAWNHGDDEPVPRVTVGDVGTRHEATADALAALLASGALSADPQLEEWVRRTYKLPERDPDVPWQPPVSRPSRANDGSQTDALSVSGSKPAARPRRKRQPSGQMTLPLAAADDPDVAVLQDDWTQARGQLLAEWPDHAGPLVDAAVAAAVAALLAGTVADLGDLAVDAAVVAGVAAVLGDAMTALAGKAAESAAAELAAAGLDGTVPDLPADRLQQLAGAFAAQLAAGYAQAAGRKALTLAGAAVDPASADAAIREVLDGMTAAAGGLAGDTFGAALSAAQQTARREVFAQYPDATFVAVEHNDANQCAPCAAVDKQEFASLADAEAAYPAGGYVGCLGGARCRGTYTIKRGGM